jgi:hypothetical protein
MDSEIVDILLFVGLGLYVINAILFLYLHLKTYKVKDGVGLVFLKLITLGIFIGSTSVAIARFNNLYLKDWDDNFGRIVAIINPLTLLGVGLYLNYLFSRPQKTFPKVPKKLPK